MSSTDTISPKHKESITFVTYIIFYVVINRTLHVERASPSPYSLALTIRCAHASCLRSRWWGEGGASEAQWRLQALPNHSGGRRASEGGETEQPELLFVSS